GRFGAPAAGPPRAAARGRDASRPAAPGMHACAPNYAVVEPLRLSPHKGEGYRIWLPRSGSHGSSPLPACGERSEFAHFAQIPGEGASPQAQTRGKAPPRRPTPPKPGRGGGAAPRKTNTRTQRGRRGDPQLDVG